MDARAHVAIFNAAVRDHDWAPFVARFCEDATVEFVGPPVGPFVGRQAIAEAYATMPPDDTISIDGPIDDRDGETVVPYRWDATAATGTMRFTMRDDSIRRLVITFDEPHRR